MAGLGYRVRLVVCTEQTICNKSQKLKKGVGGCWCDGSVCKGVMLGVWSSEDNPSSWLPLLLCRSHRVDLGCQPWWQAPSHSEPSRQPPLLQLLTSVTSRALCAPFVLSWFSLYSRGGAHSRVAPFHALNPGSGFSF